jgi:hypothetical protein
VIRKEEVVVEVGWGGVSGRKREPGDWRRRIRIGA